jgi:hypothetical protein
MRLEGATLVDTDAVGGTAGRARLAQVRARTQ